MKTASELPNYTHTNNTSVNVSIALITVFDRLLRGATLSDDFPFASDIKRIA